MKLDEENDAPPIGVGRWVCDSGSTQSLPQTWPAPSPVEAALGRRERLLCGEQHPRGGGAAMTRDREERAAIDMHGPEAMVCGANRCRRPPAASASRGQPECRHAWAMRRHTPMGPTGSRRPILATGRSPCRRARALRRHAGVGNDPLLAGRRGGRRLGPRSRGHAVGERRRSATRFSSRSADCAARQRCRRGRRP